MHKSSINTVYYLVLPFLLFGISLGYTSFALALVALIPLFFQTTRHTIGFFLVMYGGELGGVIRAVYPILPIYGLGLMFLGLFLLGDVIADLFRNSKVSLFLLIATMVLFGLFYIKGPKNDFANLKYESMWINGLFTLVGYYTLSRSKRIDAERLTFVLIIGAICMMSFVIAEYNFTRGSSILDFDWFREQSVQYEYNSLRQTGDKMLVGYQHIGMMALYGAVIYLSQINLNPAKNIFLIGCISTVILISGCRQAVLGLIVASVLRYAFFRFNNSRERLNTNRVIWITVGAIVVYFILGLLSGYSDVVNSTITEGDEGRMAHYLIAWNLFRDNPVTGVGIGGYFAACEWSWPHNFILELLCECGLVGTIIFLGIIVTVFSKSKVGLRYVSPSNMFYFLVLVAILVRIMVSSDFRESIEIFTSVFAIYSADSVFSKRTMNQNN